MLDLITDLSPKFRIAYATGGIILSVLVSDIKGATKILDKAVKEFPNDWPILYRASYHALVEEKDKAKAADLFARAVRNGAPQWVYAMAGRLYGETGQIEMAEKLLEEMKSINADEVLIKRLEDKINVLKAEQNK